MNAHVNIIMMKWMLKIILMILNGHQMMLMLVNLKL